MFRRQRLALSTAKQLRNNSIAVNVWSPSVCAARCYHSYPDPNEKPQISSAVSDVKKTVTKDSSEFRVDKKFRLDAPFPGIPQSSGIASIQSPQTLSTKLSNGLTVASQDTKCLMSSFAFLLNRGSACEVQTGNESDIDTGATHIMELLAFRSTKNRNHQQLMADMEQLGGMVQCIASREGIFYCVDVLRQNLEPAMDILAETVLNPLIPQEEIDECKEVVVLQQSELPAEILSRDAVQMAAFKGSSLGNSHFCPDERIERVNASLISKFRAKHLLGGNCFVSGAGVEHEAFVRLVEKKFGSLAAGVSPQANTEKSAFIGGMVKNERILKEPFVKVAIAFEVGGWHDPMLVPTCVLQQLLGGGSSFSAGGPGKGMYTRLYREVLNPYSWVESAEAFVAIYDKTGILGIDAACPPDSVANMVKVIVDQLTKLAFTPVTDEELNRAKNMLKSMMMMQLESRLVLCEDIARQFATYGKRELPSEVCAKIDAITAADLQKVAQYMLKSPPAVGCVGHDLSMVPAYDQIKVFTERYRMHLASQPPAQQ